MARSLGIGFTHHDVHGATRVAGTRTPPLASVDDIVVAIALNAALHVGGVRGGHVRFGHQEGRADLAAQQRLEPAVLERFAGVALEGFHVAGVRGRAVEDLGGEGHTTHDFAQRCVFQVGQAFRGALAVRNEEVPQAGLACQGLELFNDLGGNPGVALGAVLRDFSEEAGFVGVNVLFHEGQQFGLHLFDFVGVIEIHAQLLQEILVLLCGFK